MYNYFKIYFIKIDQQINPTGWFKDAAKTPRVRSLFFVACSEDNGGCMGGKLGGRG